jgi:methylamine dehydrogenase accessory protein MauD
MSGIWLISYIALWLLVIVLVLLVLGLIRQMAIMYLRLGPEPGVLATQEGLAIGAPAATFEAVHVATEAEVALLPGQAYVIIFVSPTCTPCGRLMDDLHEFIQSVGKRTHVIIVSQSDRHATLTFLEQHRLSVPVVADASGFISRAYSVRATPFAYYIDEAGIIRHRGIVNSVDGLFQLLEPPALHERRVKLPKST